MTRDLRVAVDREPGAGTPSKLDALSTSTRLVPVITTFVPTAPVEGPKSVMVGAVDGTVVVVVAAQSWVGGGGTVGGCVGGRWGVPSGVPWEARSGG